MRVGLLAEKVGMTRFYDKDKINHSVTVLQVKDCKVVAIKNSNKEIQITEDVKRDLDILIS